MTHIFAPRGLTFPGGLIAALLLTCASASASTVAHYRFDDGASDSTAFQATDESVNGHHLPALGAPLYSADVAEASLPQNGDPNAGSIELGSGQNGFAGTADDALSAVAFTDFTIEAWVLHHSVGGAQTYVGRDDQGGTGQGVWTEAGHALLYFQNHWDGNDFRVQLVTSQNQLIDVATGIVPELGVWYHVAAVGDSQAGTLSFYVNGALAGSTEGFTGLAVPQFPATPWTIGRGQWEGNPVDWLDGRIDEVRISNSALSPAEFLNFDPSTFEFTEQPESVIAWAGETVTFSAQVETGANPAADLQWEVSSDGGGTWAEVAGATSPSYVIPSASVSLDRNQYRLRASSGASVLISDVASLRVGDATPPVPQGVVAHYRFEDGSPDTAAWTAVDSANGHNLAPTGSPMFRSTVPSPTIPQTADANALSADFVLNQNNAFAGTAGDALSQIVFDDFTIETWVNFANPNGWQTMIGRDDSAAPGQGAGNASLLYFSNSGGGLTQPDGSASPANSFRIEVITRNNLNLQVNSGFVASASTWYHVAAVGDSQEGTLSLYVDGNLVGRQVGFDGLMIPESPTAWTIGRGQWAGNPGDWLNGRLDEVRISNVALSPVDFLNFSSAVLHFHTQPQDLTLAVAESATFTALAGGGSGELAYQWQLSTDDGGTWSDISGANGASYTIASVTGSQNGDRFRVVATRGGETEISGIATLNVPNYPAPVIVQDLARGHLLFEGDDFTYSVEATGVGNITYQWQKDGADLDGETANTLSLTDLTPAHEGTYSVVITDDAALAEGLEPATVTLSSVLPVAPHARGAVSLNFIGTGTANWGSTAELGVIQPFELAGAVPVANWNNSDTVGGLAVQETPLPLVSDTGAATPITATWTAGNTWSARAGAGAPTTKQPNERLFHGFIESRAEDASQTPATITISGIPYGTYDVYVYPMSVEGASGAYIRNVRMEDATGVRELFMRAYTGNPTPEEIPFVLSHAATLQEAIDGEPASYLRFGGASGSTLTLRHYDNNEHGYGWNAGGFAAISIVDTTATAPARPKLVSRPSGKVMAAGATAVLSVSAEAVNPGGTLAYQWERNGAIISGATGSTLSLANASSADNGNYTVVVTETSDLGTSVNAASAQLIVADSARLPLLSADMNFVAPDLPHAEMSGHGILRPEGPVTIDPATGGTNPHGIGEGNTIWNRLALGNQDRTYLNLVDSDGLPLSGITFTATGATGIEDAPTGGGIDEPIESWSGPLLRDYIFTENDDVMIMTLAGMSDLAGREVTLVVYAVGKSSTSWPSDPSQNDVATVTLAAQNSPTGVALSGVTNQIEGRDLRYNNDAHVIFDAVVAPNGTLTWTVGPVAGEPGLNAFNGFQVLLTDQGEAPVNTPVESWRLSYFGTTENSGDAALTADPDGDGINNLLEYALGSDPTVAGDALGSVYLDEASGFLTLTFAHIDDPALTYQIEASSSMTGDWSVVHTYPAFTAWGVETYTDTVSIASAERRFVRMTVTIAE